MKQKIVSSNREGIILLFFVLLVLMFISQPGYGQNLQIAVENLQPREVALKNLGFKLVKTPWEDRNLNPYLAEGRFREYDFRTSRTGVYALAAAGDYQVKNFDIKLYDNDRNLIDQDALEGNMPLVIFRGKAYEKFYVRVGMIDGSGFYHMVLFQNTRLSEENQKLLVQMKNERKLLDNFILKPFSEGNRKGSVRKISYHESEYGIKSFFLQEGQLYAIMASTSAWEAKDIDIDVYGPRGEKLKPIATSPKIIFEPLNSGEHLVYVSPATANITRNIDFQVGVYELSRKGTEPTLALIHDIWEEHNAYENGRKGMRIHVDLEVQNHQHSVLRALAYFSWRKSGNSLIDENGTYSSVKKRVVTGEVLLPAYREHHFEDVVLFIPYDEFHIDQLGVHNLKYDVKLYSMKTTNFLDTGDVKCTRSFAFSRDPSRNLYSSRIDYPREPVADLHDEILRRLQLAEKYSTQ